MTIDDREQWLSQELHALVPTPPLAPGLFDRVAGRARRRSAVRLAGSTLALCLLGSTGGLYWHDLSGGTGPVTSVGPAPVRSYAPTTSATGTTPSCPGLAPRGDRPPRPTVPDADRTLVPGSPASVSLCRYLGRSGPALLRVLDRSTTLRGRDVTTLATALNKAPVWYLDGAFCPIDDGSLALAVFGYRDHRTLTVQIGLRGCGFTSNGAADRTTAATTIPELLARYVGTGPGIGLGSWL